MTHATPKTAGLTLVEIVLAMGLLSLMFVALLGLLDTSLTLWGKTEARRDLVEMGAAVGELLERDLDAIDAGPRGDLVAEWVVLDGDRDGTSGSPYPRLRLVRRASRAEIARLQAGVERPLEGEGLIEVVWALIPTHATTPVKRTDRQLWRGERLVGDPNSTSFFDDAFFGEDGRPLAGTANQVTGGVLWFGMGFASQTSLLKAGWDYGSELEQCGRSWDAWTRHRPDVEQHAWNELPAGAPDADELPVLPRRVRFEIELERSADVKRRTQLRANIEPTDQVLSVRDSSRAPQPGGMILVGEEWMEVTATTRGRIQVRRGLRGTRALPHPAGATIHFGTLIVREVPIALYREDWNL